MRIIGLFMLGTMLLLSAGSAVGDDNPLDLNNALKVDQPMPADDVIANADKLTNEFKALNFENASRVDQTMPTDDIVARADKLTHEFKVLQEKIKYYECIVLTVGVVLSLIIVLYFVTSGRHTITQIVHASGLVLIVFGTIYVIILSDSETHITGTMGVLGATAGYLFGSMGKGAQQRKAVDEE